MPYPEEYLTAPEAGLDNVLPPPVNRGVVSPPTPGLGAVQEQRAGSAPADAPEKFGAAFNAARKAGKKVFTWKGKPYTTDVVEEKKPAPVKQAPAAAPGLTDMLRAGGYQTPKGQELFAPSPKFVSPEAAAKKARTESLKRTGTQITEPVVPEQATKYLKQNQDPRAPASALADQKATAAAVEQRATEIQQADPQLAPVTAKAMASQEIVSGKPVVAPDLVSGDVPLKDDPRTIPETGKDFALSYLKGAGSAVKGVGWLTGWDQLEGAGYQAEQHWAAKQSEYLLTEMDKSAKAGRQEFVERFFTHPELIGHTLAESAPAMALGAAPGALFFRVGIASARSAAMTGLAARGIKDAAFLAGAGNRAAIGFAESTLASRGVQALGSINEGLISAGMTGSDVERFILARTPDQLRGDPEFVALEQAIGLEAARKEFAERSANIAATKAGIAVTAAAGIGARTEAKLITGGKQPSTAAAIARQGGEEAAQTPAEEYAGYEQKKRVDPTQKFDPVRSAIQGTVAGVAMGGGAAAISATTEAAKPPAITPQGVLVNSLDGSFAPLTQPGLANVFAGEGPARTLSVEPGLSERQAAEAGMRPPSTLLPHAAPVTPQVSTAETEALDEALAPPPVDKNAALVSDLSVAAEVPPPQQNQELVNELAAREGEIPPVQTPGLADLTNPTPAPTLAETLATSAETVPPDVRPQFDQNAPVPQQNQALVDDLAIAAQTPPPVTSVELPDSPAPVKNQALIDELRRLSQATTPATPLPEAGATQPVTQEEPVSPPVESAAPTGETVATQPEQVAPQASQTESAQGTTERVESPLADSLVAMGLDQLPVTLETIPPTAIAQVITDRPELSEPIREALPADKLEIVDGLLRSTTPVPVEAAPQESAVAEGSVVPAPSDGTVSTVAAEPSEPASTVSTNTGATESVSSALPEVTAVEGDYSAPQTTEQSTMWGAAMGGNAQGETTVTNVTNNNAPEAEEKAPEPWVPEAKKVRSLKDLDDLLARATVSTPEEQTLQQELTTVREQAAVAPTSDEVGALMAEARKLINTYTWATNPAGDPRVQQQDIVVLQKAQSALRKAEAAAHKLDDPAGARPITPVVLQLVNPATLPAGDAAATGPAGNGTLTREVAAAVTTIAGAVGGRRVVFYSANKTTADGAFMPSSPKHLLLNADNFSTDPLVTFGHEFNHSMRVTDPDLYQLVRDVVMDGMDDAALASQYATHFGGKLPILGVVALLDTQMPGQNRTVRDALEEEVVSDLFGNRMTEAGHWQKVFNKLGKNSAVRRLAKTVMAAVAKVKASLQGKPNYATDKLVKDLDAVREAVATAQAEYMKRGGKGAALVAEAQAMRASPARSGSPIESAVSVAKSKSWATGREFKEAVAHLASLAGTDNLSEADRATLVDAGYKDALFSLNQNANAVGWYDLKTRQALAVMGLVHPELLKDENARFAFTWALAVTSNGLKVSKNFPLAEEVYSEYKRTGQMPTNVTAGTAQGAINKSLKLFNDLKAQWGIDDLRQFMLTSFTVGEISALSKDLTPGGEHVDVTVLGAAILGPKIGNGFFANLYGRFGSLTMDRWLVRTWGRWTGTLIAPDPENTAKASSRMQRAVLGLSDDARSEMETIVGHSFDTDDMAALSLAVHEASMDPELRAQMNASEAGAEVRKAGNSLWKYLDGQKEAPSGPGERKLIRSVFGGILDKVRQLPAYANLTMADLQAALWYAEKRLYETAKTKEVMDDDAEVDGYTDDEAPDYANAAAEVARSKGVSQRRIDYALKREERDGRSRDARSADSGSDGSRTGPAEQGKTAGFTPKEKRLFVRTRAVHSVRSAAASDVSQPRSYLRRSGKDGGRPRLLKALGVTYVAEWKPSTATGNRFRANGVTTTPFLELEPSQANAVRFSELISASKAALGDFGAAVYVYPVEDYAQMRLLVAPDGRGGVAVKEDGDIVSVFGSGYGDAIVQVAISAGGKKLDGFDTVLGDLYGRHGFRVAARLAWDDEQAPSDWSKAAFAKFNNGEPDVLFMYYDPDYFGIYSEADGKKATTYDQALRAQRKGVRSQENKDESTIRSSPARSNETADRRTGGSNEQGNREGQPGVQGRPTYGEPRANSVSAVGVHFSAQQRSSLNGAYYGQGLDGAERTRIMDAADKRLRFRVHFYVNDGTGVRPEQGVGAHAHSVNINNLYDFDADPQNLKVGRSRNDQESAVLDAGYAGYVADFGTGQRAAVLIGRQHSMVPVRYEGYAYRGQDTGPAQRATPSTYQQQLAAVAANRSLPGGQMTGADWKRMMPRLMPEIDVSHLKDDETYYRSNIVAKPVEPTILASLRRRPAGQTAGVNDYLVPDASPYKEQSGLVDLAYLSGKPIRLTVGVQIGSHRGHGMAHIGAEAKADGYRVPPDIDPARDDLSDDTLADVLRTLHAAPQVYRDKGRDVVLHSRGTKKAVVLASELDPKLGDYWSVKTTYPTEYRSVWGAPEGAGRLTFPATPNETSGASQTRPLDTATSQPSRTGLEVTSEPFQYRAQAPAVQVTTRRRRAVEPGILASARRDTITVDGQERPTTNSNGKPIAQTEEGLRNFWMWFGDSKVVDADGRPLVVYHGTSKDFVAFTDAAQGSNFDDYEGAFPRDGFWFTSDPGNAYWYANVSARGLEGERDGSGQRTVPVYLSSKNPYRYDAEMFLQDGEAGIPDQQTLEDDGFDGIIVEVADSEDEGVSPEAEAMWQKYTPIYGSPLTWPENLRTPYLNMLDTPAVIKHTHYVAFDPTQIKSATGNVGTFDANAPDIRRSGPRKTPEELAASADDAMSRGDEPSRSHMEQVMLEAEDRFIEAKRGVVPTADTEAAGKALAASLGWSTRDVTAVLQNGNLDIGGGKMAPAADVLAAAAETARVAVADLLDNPSVADFGQKMTDAINLMIATRANTSEIGRALNYWGWLQKNPGASAQQKAERAIKNMKDTAKAAKEALGVSGNMSEEEKAKVNAYNQAMRDATDAQMDAEEALAEAQAMDQDLADARRKMADAQSAKAAAKQALRDAQAELKKMTDRAAAAVGKTPSAADIKAAQDAADAAEALADQAVADLRDATKTLAKLRAKIKGAIDRAAAAGNKLRTKRNQIAILQKPMFVGKGGVSMDEIIHALGGQKGLDKLQQIIIKNRPSAELTALFFQGVAGAIHKRKEARAARTGVWGAEHRFMSGAVELFKASILTGTLTLMVNLSGNIGFQAIEMGATRTANKGVKNVGKHYRAYFDAIMQSYNDLWPAIKFGMTSEFPVEQFNQLTAARPELQKVLLDIGGNKWLDQQPGAIPGKAGQWVRTIGFSPLGATDAMFKMLPYRYSINLQTAMGQPVDYTEAVETAEYMTFQDALKGFLAALPQAGVDYPSLTLIMPFIKTLVNLLDRMTSMLPVVSQIKHIDDLVGNHGPEARNHAMAMGLFGVALSTLAVMLHGGGDDDPESLLSGTGPRNPDKKALWMANHEKLGLTIGESEVSLWRMDPFSDVMGLSIAASDAIRQNDEDSLTVLGTALANAIIGKSFMVGPAEMVDAAMHADTTGRKYLTDRLPKSILSAMAIPSFVNQSGDFTDRYQREALTWAETFQKRIPVLREGLNPALNYAGEPILNPRYKMPTPFPIVPKRDDPLARFLLREDIPLQRAPKLIKEMSHAERQKLLQIRAKMLKGFAKLPPTDNKYVKEAYREEVDSMKGEWSEMAGEWAEARRLQKEATGK